MMKISVIVPIYNCNDYLDKCIHSCFKYRVFGVNGLFENILYILNFAELDFENAIIYNMYKLVANGNKERVKS